MFTDVMAAWFLRVKVLGGMGGFSAVIFLRCCPVWYLFLAELLFSHFTVCETLLIGRAIFCSVTYPVERVWGNSVDLGIWLSSR